MMESCGWNVRKSVWQTNILPAAHTQKFNQKSCGKKTIYKVILKEMDGHDGDAMETASRSCRPLSTIKFKFAFFFGFGLSNFYVYSSVCPTGIPFNVLICFWQSKCKQTIQMHCILFVVKCILSLNLNSPSFVWFMVFWCFYCLFLTRRELWSSEYDTL